MRKSTTLYSTKNSALRQIIILSGPIALSLFIQALYNIMDSFYVSRYSPAGMAALSLAFPIQLLLIAVGTGISSGSGILTAYHLGESQPDLAAASLGQSFSLTLLCWGVIACFSLQVIPIYFNFFSSSSAIRTEGIGYTVIVSVFSLFSFAENTSSRTLYAEGNSLAPMCAQITGALFNILADPLFIWGFGPIPEMGINGAAAVTVLGQFLSMGLSLVFLKKGNLRVKPHDFLPSLPRIKSIVKAGFPTFFMQSLVSVYVAGLNIVLKPFGEYAITSMGIYYRYQTFLLMPTNSISLSITPLMSYYYGSGDYQRIWKLYRQSLMLSFITLFSGTIIFQRFPKQLLLLFSVDEKLLPLGIPALRIISLSFPFFSFTIIIPVLLQVLGYTKENLFITFLRQVLLLVPLAYFFSHWGVTAVWITFPVSEILAAILSWHYKKKTYGFLFPKTAPNEP